MHKYIVNKNLVRAIEHLYEKALSTAQMNDKTCE